MSTFEYSCCQLENPDSEYVPPHGSHTAAFHTPTQNWPSLLKEGLASQQLEVPGSCMQHTERLHLRCLAGFYTSEKFLSNGRSSSVDKTKDSAGTHMDLTWRWRNLLALEKPPDLQGRACVIMDPNRESEEGETPPHTSHHTARGSVSPYHCNALENESNQHEKGMSLVLGRALQKSFCLPSPDGGGSCYCSLVRSN